MKDLTVIIPAYNEEAGILGTLKEVKKQCKDSKILVVNDCSSDNTAKIIKESKIKNVKVITHKKNMGYGVALKTGFRESKTKYVAFLDADMTYPPKYLPQMYKLCTKGYDFVWGNRFGGKINGMPTIRKLGNRFLYYFYRLWTGVDPKDPTSGLRMFRRDVLKKLDYLTLPPGLDVITALTKRITSRKLKFIVIPIDYYDRKGSSKLNVITVFLKMWKNILFEK